MARNWEYLRVLAFFSGGPPTGMLVRLAPRRDSYAKLVASVELTVLEKDPEASLHPVAFDTVVRLPWASREEKYFALIDALTADGWEPFDVKEDGSVRVMHLRRDKS